MKCNNQDRLYPHHDSNPGYVLSQQRQDQNVLSHSSNVQTKWIQWAAPLNIQDSLSNWRLTHIRGFMEFSWLTWVFRLVHSVSGHNDREAYPRHFYRYNRTLNCPTCNGEASQTLSCGGSTGILWNIISRYEHWIKSFLDNAIDTGNVASRSVYGFTTVRDRKRMTAIKNVECVQ